jgi:hypothetical protein
MRIKTLVNIVIDIIFSSIRIKPFAIHVMSTNTSINLLWSDIYVIVDTVSSLKGIIALNYDRYNVIDKRLLVLCSSYRYCIQNIYITKNER